MIMMINRGRRQSRLPESQLRRIGPRRASPRPLPPAPHPPGTRLPRLAIVVGQYVELDPHARAARAGPIALGPDDPPGALDRDHTRRQSKREVEPRAYGRRLDRAQKHSVAGQVPHEAKLLALVVPRKRLQLNRSYRPCPRLASTLMFHRGIPSRFSRERPYAPR